MYHFCRRWAASTTVVHFLISLAMKSPNSFGSVVIGRLPNDLNRASTSGSRSTVAKARWIVASASGGTPAGARMPRKPIDSKSFSPASWKVGRSGRPSKRCDEEIASARTFPEASAASADGMSMMPSGNMRAEQIGHDRTGALVGHQRDVESGRIIEQRRGEMHDRAAVPDRQLGIAALLGVDHVAQGLERRIRPAPPSMNGWPDTRGDRLEGLQRDRRNRFAEREGWWRASRMRRTRSCSRPASTWRARPSQ